ncbi:MAG: ribonuclease P protein component [Alphaproteobacteria bacterium]|nr:ribonuclease P protein component [Alphaproteobacteria bacterium]
MRVDSGLLPPTVLKKRREFLQVQSKGKRVVQPDAMVFCYHPRAQSSARSSHSRPRRQSQAEPPQPAQNNPAHHDLSHKNDPVTSVRFGLTATKKYGKAVDRNRAKRRLRYFVMNDLPAELHAKLQQHRMTIVLTARGNTGSVPYAALRQQLILAIERGLPR